MHEGVHRIMFREPAASTAGFGVRVRCAGGACRSRRTASATCRITLRAGGPRPDELENVTHNPARLAVLFCLMFWAASIRLLFA